MAGGCKTLVAVGGTAMSDGAKSRVRRTESTRPDIGDELTVIRQVRQCLAVQTLADNKAATSWQIPRLRGSYGETCAIDFWHKSRFKSSIRTTLIAYEQLTHRCVALFAQCRFSTARSITANWLRCVTTANLIVRHSMKF